MCGHMRTLSRHVGFFPDMDHRACSVKDLLLWRVTMRIVKYRNIFPCHFYKRSVNLIDKTSKKRWDLTQNSFLLNASATVCKRSISVALRQPIRRDKFSSVIKSNNDIALCVFVVFKQVLR